MWFYFSFYFPGYFKTVSQKKSVSSQSSTLCCLETAAVLQFIIEAVAGGVDGSISIRDIVVSSSVSGSCPAERECTFQGSLCGLQPQPSADFSWSRIKGESQPANSSGPATDHTLGTEQGFKPLKIWSHLAFHV